MAGTKRIGQGLVVVAALLAYVTTVGATADTSYQQHKVSTTSGVTGIQSKASRVSTIGGVTAPTTSIPQATTTTVPSVNSGNALLRWAPTMGGGNVNQVITVAQAISDATTYNVIVGLQRTFQPFLAQMHQANPSLKMIVYLNGAFAQSTQGSLYPSSWYSRNAQGGQVIQSSFANFMMDPDNAGWIQNRQQSCAQDMALGGWNGCYLDAVGPGSFIPGYLDSTPIDAATGQPWTDAAWVAATSSLAQQVQLANPSALIVANGINNGYAFLTPSLGPTSKFFNAVGGGVAQGWLRPNNALITQNPSESRWLDDVNLLVSAGAEGKSVFAYVKVWTPASLAQITAVHSFALASFLLGTNGHQYFYFNSTGSESAAPPDSAYDHVDIGMPTGAYVQEADGVFERSFTGGMVVANPTTSTITVALGATYIDLEGNSVSSMTLAPDAGDVLTS